MDNDSNIFCGLRKETPATVLERPLWRTEFFGLEDVPVKSVKMKVNKVRDALEAPT